MLLIISFSVIIELDGKLSSPKFKRTRLKGSPGRATYLDTHTHTHTHARVDKGGRPDYIRALLYVFIRSGTLFHTLKNISILYFSPRYEMMRLYNFSFFSLSLFLSLSFFLSSKLSLKSSLVMKIG